MDMTRSWLVILIATAVNIDEKERAREAITA
jgi:hypothetical protein